MLKPLPSRRKRRLIALTVISVLLVAAGAAYMFYVRPRINPSSPTPAAVVTPPEEKKAVAAPSVTVSAMGDMLAHDSVVNQAKTADGYDFTPYFTQISPLVEKSDVVFCNAETPSAGQAYGISGYPTFNAPTEFARDLSKSGCNLINTASNHMTDKGQAALVATLDEWQRHKPLAVAGANRSAEEQRTVRYFEKNGVKIAFLAFADFSNGAIPHEYSINLYRNTDLVTQLMTEARQQAEAVIVSMHWGAEDSHQVNNNQRTAAKMMADLGADVIIGTGPHVLQPVEWVDGTDGHRTLVWYSIGNMLSSQLHVDQLTGGVATFRMAKENDRIVISDIGFSGTFMSYEWSAAERQAQRLEARRNLMLQPLKNAQATTQLFGVTVDERTAKIREWLGSSVEIAEL